MSWDKVKMGFYCDRCEAPIWMDIRQDRFLKLNPSPGLKGGDPYLSVSWVAFGDPSKPNFHGFHYCFDCEPTVVAVIKALNKEK